MLLAQCPACKRPQPVLSGIYSGRFDWRDGLKDVNLDLESYPYQRLDLRNREIRKEVESLIQAGVKLANVRIAQGRIRIEIIGSSPYLILGRGLEIQVPDFGELLRRVETRNVDGIREFVERYHDVNQRELPGQRTAMYYAAMTPDVKPVQVLLELGADPTLSDFEGDTPLMNAVMGNCYEVAHLLILSGADVNRLDEAGDTPLTRAVEMGRPKLLTLLLQSGADPNRAPPHGKSALQIARELGDQAAIAALQKAGALR